MRRGLIRTLPRYTQGQRGQALVFGVLAASAAGVVLVMLYNVGQVALARSRLTQATDAAAYSAALVQARSLNMLAHVQRSQVGHQVAIAHLVTLGAWAQFSDTEHANYRRGNPPAMIINRFFGPRHKQGYAQSKAMPAGMRQALTRAMAGHDQAAHQVLAGVARQLVEGLPKVRAAVIEQVLSANLPTQSIQDAAIAQRPRLGGVFHDASMSKQGGAAPVQWSITGDTWADMLARHTSRQPGHTDPLVQMVRRAVKPYAFLRERNHITFNPWSIHPACPLMFHILQRKGSTWLDDSGRWQAMDVQAFHARRFNRLIGCYYREYIMGTGAVRSDRSNPDGLTQDDMPDLSRESFWRWVRRSTSWDLTFAESRWAAMAALFKAWSPPQRGLAPWFDIRPKAAPTADFVLEVRQDMATVPTSDQTASRFGPIGRFAFGGLGKGARMIVRSAGQTYFSPDDRRDSASAFRPQWRARLAPVAREGGQALMESLMVMLLLAVFAAAALEWGNRIQVNVQDDLTSRWLAFTTSGDTKSAKRGAALDRNPERALPGARRGARLRAEPGGRGADATEMRQAWHYADQGLVEVRVGARRTAVARDAGHHHDHQATQRRLGQSNSAWAHVAQASQNAGKRVQAQAGQVDVGWRRAQPSFDWLTPWADLDLRPSRRPRRSVKMRRVVFRRPRSPRRGGTVPRLAFRRFRSLRRNVTMPRLVFRRPRSLRHAACLAIFLAIAPSAAAHCAIAGLTAAANAQLAMQSPSLRADLKALGQALERLTVVNGDSTHASLWFGIPMATRTFSLDPTVAGSASAQPVPGLSVAARLTAAHPHLKDFAVVRDVLMLSGQQGDRHWLAQWQERSGAVSGVISTMRTGLPAYDVQPPAWMGPSAYPTMHRVYLAGGPSLGALRQRRPPASHSEDGLRWASMSVWHSALRADRVAERMTNALGQLGWTRTESFAPPLIHWQQGRCAMDVRISAGGDHNAAGGTQIWIQSLEDPQ